MCIRSKGVLAVFGSMLLFGTITMAQSKPSTNTKTATNTVTASDRSFMDEAAQGGMAEVQLGQLAEQNAQSQDVKNFGKKMVEDHSRANDQLKEIAKENNVTLPAKLDVKDEATLQRLSKLHGEAFDKAYMKDMVADHKKDIAAFRNEADTGKDTQVKNWASQTVSILDGHLKLAEQVNTKVGAETAASKPSAMKNAGKS